MKKEEIDIDKIFNTTKQITSSSLKLYKQKLSILNDRKPIYNFNFLKTPDVIKEKIKDLKPTTQRTYYITIVSLLKCLSAQNPSKTLYKTLYAHYYENLTKLNNDLKTTNGKSETEEKNWINQSEVEERQKELESILPEVSNKKKLSKIQYDKLLDLILLSLYTLQKPRRNLDYLNMVVKKKLNDEGIEDLQKEKLNAIDLANKRFVFTNFKTAGTYKVQIIEINEELMKLIMTYLKYHPLRSMFDGYQMLVDNEGHSFKSSTMTTKKLNNIFGDKNISSSMLRKIYLTNKYSDMKQNLEEDAKEMGTSFNTINNHYIKDEDK